jgi:hypothetical protein
MGELEKHVDHVSVYAPVSPEHKLCAAITADLCRTIKKFFQHSLSDIDRVIDLYRL